MSQGEGDGLDGVRDVLLRVVERVAEAEAKADVALSALGVVLGIMASGRPNAAAQLDRMLLGMSRLLAPPDESLAELPTHDPRRVVVLAKTAAVEHLRRSAEAALADFSPGGALHTNESSSQRET